MRQAILGALCAISVCALFAFSKAPARTGDFTCINPNAIRSFHLSGAAASYTTSATKSFMITDIIGYITSGPALTLRVNGANTIQIPKKLYEFNVAGGAVLNQWFDPVNLVSGIPVAAGSVITEASGLAVTVCGYEY